MPGDIMHFITHIWEAATAIRLPRCPSFSSSSTAIYLLSLSLLLLSDSLLLYHLTIVLKFLSFHTSVNLALIFAFLSLFRFFFFVLLLILWLPSPLTLCSFSLSSSSSSDYYLYLLFSIWIFVFIWSQILKIFIKTFMILIFISLETSGFHWISSDNKFLFFFLNIIIIIDILIFLSWFSLLFC